MTGLGRVRWQTPKTETGRSTARAIRRSICKKEGLLDLRTVPVGGWFLGSGRNGFGSIAANAVG